MHTVFCESAVISLFFNSLINSVSPFTLFTHSFTITALVQGNKLHFFLGSFYTFLSLGFGLRTGAFLLKQNAPRFWPSKGPDFKKDPRRGGPSANSQNPVHQSRLLTNLRLLLGSWIPFTHLCPVPSKGQRSKDEKGKRGSTHPFSTLGILETFSELIFLRAF